MPTGQGLKPLKGTVDATNLEVRSWKLSNGLKVLLVSDLRAPEISVHVGYRVGSKDERPDERGATFLMEALMGSGSEGVPEGRTRLLCGIWAEKSRAPRIRISLRCNRPYL